MQRGEQAGLESLDGSATWDPVLSEDIHARLSERTKFTSRTVSMIIDDLAAQEPGLVTAQNRDTPRWARRSRHDFLAWGLDIMSGIVITINIFVMALQTQYNSHGVLQSVQQSIDNSTVLNSDPWPEARVTFTTLDWIFGMWFIIELCLRLVFRVHMQQERLFNVLDVVIIAAWVAERVSEGGTNFNPTVLRLVRLVRLARFAKLLRHVRILDPLYLIVKAIQSSMSVLLWAVAMMLLLMMIVAMLNSSILETFIRDRHQESEDRMEVYRSWGSFMRAYVSMFEITLANWGPQCWLLMNKVSEHWGFFFILWRCCFGFAVVQVITSVFIQHTFQVASRDEDIMIKEKEKVASAFLMHLENLFTKLDHTGCGAITSEEFHAAIEDPRVRLWFAALDVDASKLPAVFQMLDNGDGAVSKEEFIDGLKKLKGQAQSIDLLALRKDVQRLQMMLSHAAGAMGMNMAASTSWRSLPAPGGRPTTISPRPRRSTTFSDRPLSSTPDATKDSDLGLTAHNCDSQTPSFKL